MAKLMWAITCGRVLTDKESNSVSYIGSIEALAAVKLPLPCPLFFIGTLWLREQSNEPLHSRFSMMDPDGKTIMEFKPDPKKLSEGSLRQRLNIQVGGMQLEKPGPYLIKIEQKLGNGWKTEQTIQIDITILKSKPG